jgi:hypothetical protein
MSTGLVADGHCTAVCSIASLWDLILRNILLRDAQLCNRCCRNPPLPLRLANRRSIIFYTYNIRMEEHLAATNQHYGTFIPENALLAGLDRAPVLVEMSQREGGKIRCERASHC